MPIYEYQCGACGARQEFLQKLSDEPMRDCPACAAPELKKMVTAAAFKLNGTGWYETDFKNSGKAAAPAKSDAGKDASAGAATTASSSADSKPAAGDSAKSS